MKSLIGSKSRISAGIAILFAVLSISYGCTKDDMPDSPGGGGGGGTKGPGPNEVYIQDMVFNPGTITVAANTTIKWTNKDLVVHTVTSDNGLFDSGNIAAGGTWSQTFTAVGTYPYHCTPHPAMTATVVVN